MQAYCLGSVCFPSSKISSSMVNVEWFTTSSWASKPGVNGFQRPDRPGYLQRDGSQGLRKHSIVASGQMAGNIRKHQETQKSVSHQTGFFSHPTLGFILYISILSMTSLSQLISVSPSPASPCMPCCALEEAWSLQDQTWGETTTQRVASRFVGGCQPWLGMVEIP